MLMIADSNAGRVLRQLRANPELRDDQASLDSGSAPSLGHADQGRIPE
jgi:hypothetical protein